LPNVFLTKLDPLEVFVFITKFALLIVLFFLVNIVVSVYRYSQRLAAQYDAQTYALGLSNVPLDPNFHRLVRTLTPKGIDFGKVEGRRLTRSSILCARDCPSVVTVIKRRAEKCSPFRLSASSAIFRACQIIVAIGFRAELLYGEPARPPFGSVGGADRHIARRGSPGAHPRTLPHRPCPPGGADLPGRWRAIKTAFVKCWPPGESRSPIMTSRGERVFGSAAIGSTRYATIGTLRRTWTTCVSTR
jgi:hypothetical protein